MYFLDSAIDVSELNCPVRLFGFSVWLIKRFRLDAHSKPKACVCIHRDDLIRVFLIVLETCEQRLFAQKF